MATGLSLLFAAGREKRIWGASVDKLNWALAHTANRHPEAADGIDVFIASFPLAASCRTGHAGIWKCDKNIPAEDVVLYRTYAPDFVANVLRKLAEGR
jgi:hypothetical protein